jgi:hypothetical protein
MEDDSWRAAEVKTFEFVPEIHPRKNLISLNYIFRIVCLYSGDMMCGKRHYTGQCLRQEKITNDSKSVILFVNQLSELVFLEGTWIPC